MKNPKNKLNPKKIIQKGLLVIAGLMLLVSCSNEKEDGGIINSSSTENKIPKETIDLIAKNFFKNSSLTGKSVSQNRTIKNTKEYKTSKKESAFYVVNYSEGGFIILAADNRVSPILAYSDSGTFDTTEKQIIPPVAYWIETKKAQIQSIINSNQSQNKDVKLEWEGITSNVLLKTKNGSTTARIIEPEPEDCPDVSTVTVGPFIKSNWGQGDTYNNLLTYDCGFGTKPPTGCVATAMAQVMRFLQKPASYNWANMPNGYGTSDTQLLMKNIGVAVSMQYGCSESSAYGNSMGPALVNTFGYLSASYGGFNQNTLITNLNTNRPVILTGVNPSNTSGHAWVCDGYMQSTFYFKDDYGRCTGQAVTYKPSFHMNWGWSGSYNGYYTYGNFNPTTGYSYNNSVQMLYNIW
jgi:hypothetical protein